MPLLFGWLVGQPFFHQMLRVLVVLSLVSVRNVTLIVSALPSLTAVLSATVARVTPLGLPLRVVRLLSASRLVAVLLLALLAMVVPVLALVSSASLLLVLLASLLGLSATVAARSLA